MPLIVTNRPQLPATGDNSKSNDANSRLDLFQRAIYWDDSPIADVSYLELAMALFHNNFNESSGNILILSLPVPERSEPFQQTLKWLLSLAPSLSLGMPRTSSDTKNWLSRAIQERRVLSGYDALRLVIEQREIDLPHSIPFSFKTPDLTYEGQIKMHVRSKGYFLKMYFVGQSIDAWPQLKHHIIRLFLGTPETADLDEVNIFTRTPRYAGHVDPSASFAARIFADRKKESIGDLALPCRDTRPNFKELVSMAIKEPLQDLVNKYYGHTPWQNEIKQWRRARINVSGTRITRAQQAAIWGLSEKTLQLIENNSRQYKPSRETVLKIAQALSIDPNIIFYRLNREHYPSLEDHWTRTPDEEIYINTKWLSDLLERLQRNLGTNYQQDLRYQVLKAHFNKYREFGSRSSYEIYTPDSLYRFLTLGAVPDPATLSALAELTNRPLTDFYAFVIDHHYPPALRRALDDLEQDVAFKRWMHSHHFDKLNFSIQAPDEDRIQHYVKKPYQLGFKIWVMRKMLGLDFSPALKAWGVADHVLYPIEMDKAKDHFNPKFVADFASSIGIPVPVLKSWIDDTYGKLKPNFKVKKDFQAARGSLKEMMLTAMGGLANYEAAVVQCNAAMSQICEQFANLTTDLLEYILKFGKKCPPKDSDEITRGTFSDTHLAAFNLAFGEEINSAKFWALARPDLLTLFPTLKGDKPFIELPTGTTWRDIWNSSLAERITGWRVGAYAAEAMGPARLAEIIGTSAPVAVSLAESKDHASLIGNLVRTAERLGVNPALVYLARHPWILLGVPVKNSQGQLINLFGGDSRPKSLSHAEMRSLIAKEIVRGLALLRDSRQTILKVMRMGEVPEVNDQDKLQKKLQAIGFSMRTANRMIHKERILSDDELLQIAESPHFNDTKLEILEGARKGQLLFFMGYGDDNAIDWTWPDGWDETRLKSLNLKEIAEQAASWHNESFRSFWMKQPGFNVKSLNDFESRLKKGFTDEDIYQFSKIASAIGHGELTPKVLFLYFRLGFLKKFTQLKAPEPKISSMTITETAPPGSFISFEAEEGGSDPASVPELLPTHSMVPVSPIIATMLPIKV